MALKECDALRTDPTDGVCCTHRSGARMCDVSSLITNTLLILCLGKDDGAAGEKLQPWLKVVLLRRERKRTCTLILRLRGKAAHEPFKQGKNSGRVLPKIRAVRIIG